MGMNWLITGGCGFIGTALVKELVAEGDHFIRIIDNLSVGTRENLARVCSYTEFDPHTLSPDSDFPTPDSSPSVQLIVGDILDEGLTLKAAEKIEVIVHLAASTGVGESVEDPRSDCLANVIGTLNYLEAARHNQVKRFIFASSGAPIGEREPPIHEELAARPVSPYGASKLSAEGYCSAYFRTYGVETVALRFGNVYGPGSDHKNSVVAKFIKQAMYGETLEIYGDGRQTRDFIYIEDLMSAIRKAVTASHIGGEVFQIGTNKERTVAELVEKLLPILAQAGIKDVDVSHGPPRRGDLRRNFSDTAKARKLLRWKPRVDFNEGLSWTVRWFTHQKKGLSKIHMRAK
jgi:UDP-glucose 4-epimerase